jgi:hypothetical protein
MSDIRKLLSIVTESTTAGSIATNAAVPLTSETIKRENKPSEYGNWENSLGEEKVRLDKSCWKGYKKQGTKMKGDTRVNNCVPTKKVKESLEVYPDPEDHSFDTLEHAKKYALRRASHLRDSSDTIEIWKDKQKNKFWVNHSMNWNQRQTLEKRANLVDNVSRRDVKESNLTKGQKKARQVSATEPTKSIRVLGNKPQKHPFDGKLVGVAESYRDDPNSLSSKIPSTDTIPQDSTAAQAQQQAMVDRMKQQTIDRILDIKPEWGRSDLSLMTAAELNQILRDLPLPAKRAKKDVTEMDKSQPSHGRDGKISHSTYGSRDKKGSDYFKGKEVPVKPITVKKMEKDALDILKKQGVAEATGDITFDQILKDITSKKAVKKQRQSDTKQQSKRSFDSMFGGGNPAVILDIRKKKVTESFSWNSLDSGLSLDNKMTIFEEYYTKGNLFESIDENEKSYFMSLFNMSSTPEKNNRYIVAPLSLVGNKIMTLAKPRYLEYLGKSKGQLVFKSDKGQIRYPSETMRDLSVSNTFTFSSVDLYNKFRTALILKFNADLPRIMGVAEGAMKDIMHADAEQLELKDFIEKYGNEDWVKEFWHNINDIGDHTLHETEKDIFERSNDLDFQLNVDQAVTEARDPKEFIRQVVDMVQADDAYDEINDLINKLGIKNLTVTTGSENIYINDKSRAHHALPKTEIHLTYGRDGHRFAKRSDVERAKNSIRTQYKIGAIKEESAMFEDELSEEQLKEKLKKEMNLFMKSHRSKNKELSTKPKDREIHKKV